jgi:hypothetical protein
MSRKYEPPVETEEHGHTGRETKITHPSFGQIGASRVQGSTQLYGSELQHQHYMTVTIRRSTLHRTLSSDHSYAGEELIEVALSEAQWATFVSTPNSGFGVACTIQHLDRKPVPQLPPPTKTQGERFEKDIYEVLGKILKGMDGLSTQLEGALSKTKVAELKKTAEMLRSHLQSNTRFVGDMFVEHMENVVEKAKIEVNAYATATIQRAGLTALAEKNGDAPVTLLMPEKTKEQP